MNNESKSEVSTQPQTIQKAIDQNTLLSLRELAPQLTEDEIKMIFQKCNQDFNQSVDHLLSIQIQTSNSTNCNQNESKNDTNGSTKTVQGSEIKKRTMIVIERIGRQLLNYHKSTAENKLKINIKQMLNDFVFIQAHDKKHPNLHLHEFIDNYLKQNYFTGANECKLQTCKCIKINTRNRMEKMSKNTNNFLENNDFLLSSIHCSFLHSFDSGYRLSTKEMEMIDNHNRRTAGNSNEDEIEDEDMLRTLFDKQTVILRHTINDRKSAYQNIRGDVNHKSNGNQPQISKFVTLIEVDDSKTNVKTNAKSDENIHAMIGYSFGIKFYYWKNTYLDSIDIHYNGGCYTYGDWYISKKFKSMKNELFENPWQTVPNEEWIHELQKMESWMLTKYVKKMVVAFGDGTDYNLISSTPISSSHLLSLAFYTNFTSLCTIFSSVFRRCPSSETDDSLKERNSNFREWARFLIETVHVFGCRMNNSNIDIFFHGISIEMTFHSTFAVFCSPTSTTNSYLVAVRFSFSGLILELKNNKSNFLSYFDCSIMSDYSNECEKLFINGGFYATRSELRSTALPFYSIRNMKLNYNFQLYIISISSFQMIIKGQNGIRNVLQSKKKHIRILQKLIDNEFSVNKKMSHHGLYYIQSMFHNYVQSLAKIQIYVPLLNKKLDKYEKYQLFLVYRPLFCELFSDEILQENKEQWMITHDEHYYHSLGFVNPIISVKIALLLRLCPNVKEFDILYLPVTHYLMKQLLDIFVQLRAKNLNECKIERFFVGVQYYKRHDIPRNSYPLAQSDFKSYAECVDEYKKEFADNGWEMSFIKKRSVNDSGMLEQFVTGLEIASIESLNQ